MDELREWRTLLGTLISDPQERQRLASAIAVNPVTLTRWVTNKSQPRSDNLRQLLEALPQHREQLAVLMREEFPTLATYEQDSREGLQEIRSEFYASVMSSSASLLPIVRTHTIITMILQQIVEHFDPMRQGMIVSIEQCVPPVPGERVHSLRRVMEQTSSEGPIEYRTQFCGAESQAGRTVLYGSLISVQNIAEMERRYAIRYQQKEASLVTSPIMKMDRFAGCLTIFMPQQNYFTPQHLKLVRAYANLLVPGFEENDFYSLSEIDLGIIPPLSLQLPLFRDFRLRVTRYMAQVPPECGGMTRPQAEQIVWKQIENELLSMPFSEKRGA